MQVIVSTPLSLSIQDQTISTLQGSLSIQLAATSSSPTPVIYEVTPQLLDGAAQLAYQLDQDLNLRFQTSYYENSLEAGEKWIQSNQGWLTLYPDGALHRYVRGAGRSDATFIATLNATYHATPSLLHDAQAPTAGGTAQIVDGNRLLINPADGFTGSLSVTVFASDSTQTVEQTFTVTVQ